MKVLSIGNSFSQDAHRYLHSIAKNRGVDLQTVNLYIGGCSLRTHYLNVLGDKQAYDLEFNGVNTGVKVSIKQVLESVEWDVITLQQVSHLSFNQESYSPYLQEVILYVEKYCPNSKIYMHETWAYANGSEKLANTVYNTAIDMFNDVKKTYLTIANQFNINAVIPSGSAMINALSLGIQKIYRDGFHASLGIGRYLLGLTWYKTITGNSIDNDSFCDFDEKVTDFERKIAIQAVNLTVK